MRKLVLIIFTLIVLVNNSFAQNNTCANAQPFCTGTPVSYPAGTNAGQAQAGPNYGCLFSQPNPAWFSLQIATPGPLSIVMQANQDIDFVLWGPFPNLTGNCGNLTAANIVPNSGGNTGCSYSGSNTETLVIANAQVGQNYILLITNFSNSNQQINFNQNNSNNPGAGTTNCGILCSFTANATSTVCSSGTATFGVVTGTSITNVVWNGPGGFNLPTGNGSYANIPVTASGNYTALATTTGTNPATNTCALTKSITVRPTPTPVVTGATVCANSAANISVAGGIAGSTYAWVGPSAFSSNIQNPSIPNAQAVNNGVYTASITTNGCTGSGTGTVVVKSNPTVTANSNGNYCYGQSITLNSNGANTYNWSGPNGYTSISQNPVISVNSLTNSGTYTVLGTVNGCTNTAVTNVTINPLPTINVVSSGNVCALTSLTLTASGANAYTWVGPGNFTSNNAVNTFSAAPLSLHGNYTVTGIDANGCVNTGTLNQIIYTLPNPGATGSRACLNDQLSLFGSGGATYVWIGPNGFTSNLQNPTISGAMNVNQGTYSVIVTSANGCVRSTTTECFVYPLPTIYYSGIGEVCKGEKFTFKAHGGLDYKWLGTFGEINRDSILVVASDSPSVQTSYTLVGADGNGCVNQTVVNPIVIGLPSTNILADRKTGCVPLCTKFNAVNTPVNVIKMNWVISNGASFSDSSSVFQCFNDAGKYNITVNMVNDKGCKGTSTYSVEAYPIPLPEFSYEPENPTENNFEVFFHNTTSNTPIQNLNWDFYSTGTATSTASNPSYNFPDIGNYFIKLKTTSIYGCADSIVKQLTVVPDPTFFVPNAFTPNADGNNDTFYASGIEIEKFSMDIFNRGGELIFSSKDITKGWDGTYKGKQVPTNVYVYKIMVVHKNSKQKTYTGHVTLMR